VGQVYGEFIRRVRESRGISQDELACVTGISQPNLSAYERNRRVPTADTLNKIVVACGYELAATDEVRTLFCPLPVAGWFPDEEIPSPEADDPHRTGQRVQARLRMAERVHLIEAVLELAEATRGHRRTRA